MPTTSKTFDKDGTTIYHSDIAKHHDGLLVQFTGTPRDSKYPGKPRWVGFKVDGDDSKYSLNLENASVERSIAAVPQNTWVLLKAGGRGEDASVAIEDANGNPVFKGVPANEIAQPQNGPPPNWPEGASLQPAPKQASNVPAHPVSTNGDATVQRATALTLQAVKGLQAGGVNVDSDAAARMFSTIYIQAHK